MLVYGVLGFCGKYVLYTLWGTIPLLRGFPHWPDGLEQCATTLYLTASRNAVFSTCLQVRTVHTAGHYSSGEGVSPLAGCSRAVCNNSLLNRKQKCCFFTLANFVGINGFPGFRGATDSW